MSELREDLERFETIANKLLNTNAKGNTNTQTTTIDAGSKFLWFGLWLASTCCVVMFLMNLNQGRQIEQMNQHMTEMARKLEADSDRLSILLQWAPNLRDEVNKEMKEKHS